MTTPPEFDTPEYYDGVIEANRQRAQQHMELYLKIMGGIELLLLLKEESQKYHQSLAVEPVEDK